MNEVICHIASYDAIAAYKLTMQLFALHLATFAGIGVVVLIIQRFNKRINRRPYHV